MKQTLTLPSLDGHIHSKEADVKATERPITWTIAGSDSGGGAGIQADLKTMNALGCHGASVITALTAQNTQHVTLVESVSTLMLEEQLHALQTDLPPKALKLGMMGSVDGSEAISHVLASLTCPIVCDPVLVATSGDRLVSEVVLEALKAKIFPLATLITPNLKEAEVLLGQSIETQAEMELAAKQLQFFWGKAVLLKGGHFENLESKHLESSGPAFAQDFFTDGTRSVWLTSPWQATQNTHGTGCTLSAAITSALALGYDLLDAVVIAKAYVNQGLRLSPQVGSGHGPLSHLGWPETEIDLPWITPTTEQGRQRLRFPNIGSLPLGVYPVVERANWLEKLLPEGVSIIQLRVKDLKGEALSNEIKQAVATARKYDARLFINDYWQLAIEHGAYGVHLGQEDLATADLEAIHKAGLRLGVSTHCYREVARALALQPSYLAIGPIFHTTTKTMTFEPQGVDALKRWRRSLGYPLVAIGGIFLDRGKLIREAGADGIAVVRDITQAENVPNQIAQWAQLFS
jgi:hydroxymethylpyrimidine kinase/phosphomethylpyrimidine kinase/thiamine-phosphate diphosphorylase